MVTTRRGRTTVTVRHSRPAMQHSWWRRILGGIRWPDGVRQRALLSLVTLSLLAGWVAWYLSRMPAAADPAIVLRATSHAIALVPAANLDVVRAARPLYGVESDGTQYAGFRIVPDSAEILLGDILPAPGPVRLVRSLVITPGCVLRIEQYVRSYIRMNVEQAPDRTCRMRAELSVVAQGDDSRYVERDIAAASPASLVFRASLPLRFTNVPVTRIGFETKESGEWRSAIVHAGVALSDTESDSATADIGEDVRLGALHGSIVELIVSDTIRTLYKGTAAQPDIAAVALRPSRLVELARNENLRLIVAVAVSLLTLLAAFYQAVLK